MNTELTPQQSQQLDFILQKNPDVCMHIAIHMDQAIGRACLKMVRDFILCTTSQEVEAVATEWQVTAKTPEGLTFEEAREELLFLSKMFGGK